MLVNGTYAPYLEVPEKLVRLRLFNGSAARRYNFGFSDEGAFHQIATDGGLLAAPVERRRPLLAPGERAEILVDLSDRTEPIMLMSYAFADSENSLQNEIQEGLTGGTDEGQQFRILELRPKTGTFAAEQVPNVLNTIQFDENEALRTRRFVLEAFTINGKRMDHERIDEVVRTGDTEIWEVTNNSPIYHPFHIHGVQFLLLDRNGMEPAAYEQGWKDTVFVTPQETVRLIMRGVCAWYDRNPLIRPGGGVVKPRVDGHEFPAVPLELHQIAAHAHHREVGFTRVGSEEDDVL